MAAVVAVVSSVGVVFVMSPARVKGKKSSDRLELAGLQVHITDSSARR
jgi:hypothetical protein